MQRKCDRCGKTYPAKRSTSRFCSSGCRAEASEARKHGLPESIAPVVDMVAADPVSSGPLTDSTDARLAAAERADSPLGLAALALAQRIDSGNENGSAMAVLVREFRTTLDRALEGGARPANRLDELMERRKAKAAGA